MIDFDLIEEKEEISFKGGVGSAFLKKQDDGLNRIMKIRLEQGSSIGLHRHEDSSEIIYILSGKATVTTDGITETVPSGCVSYCKKGSEHTVKNEEKSDLIFFAVVPMH